MAESEVKARSNNSRMFDIPADSRDGNQRPVILVLPESEDPTKYVIVKKDIPGQARQKGPNITWINNFGIKQRGQFVSNIDYYVVVDALSGKNKYYYLVFDDANPDNSTVQEFAANDINKNPSDYQEKWVLTMHSGDPAVGWGGG